MASARDDRGGDAGRSNLPFATATVAAIYLDQGKLDEAEQVFRSVLAREPGNRRCQDGLTEIVHRRQADSAAVVDTVEAELSGEAGAIACRYEVSDSGLRRARLTGAEQGQLTLRLVSFPAEDHAAPQDTPLTAETGEIKVAPPSDATLAIVAVGLLGPGGAFTSIAHSKILQIAGH